MRCRKTTVHPGAAAAHLGALAVILALATGSAPAQAQIDGVLEEITVTAQKREESLFEVPISVATLSGENYEVLFSGSEDILALSGRVPGLYAESSNGRAAPRFYLRGLGNIDFDLAASQPVSIVMDEVVMENVVLKSFPLFDMDQVEVIRGPQGTLFGRNTTAGIIKFNSVRPSHETSGYAKASWATHDTINLEGAIGGSLIADTLSARISALHRSRDNWITNGLTGQESLGEYDETAVRVQFDWTISDNLAALLLVQARDLDGTSSIFRANVFNTGSPELNQNYDRETVYYDGGDNNPQAYESEGVTLNLQWDGDNVGFTSITSFQQAEGSSRGDIDGGVVDFSGTITPPPGVSFDPDVNIFGDSALTFPGTIFVSSVTEDGADTDQFTQEFRLASSGVGAFNWQVGAFYFDSSLEVTTDSFASFGFVDRQDTIIEQENTTWAVFGQGSYDLTDALNLTAGVRYTDDDRDFRVVQFGQLWLDLGIPTAIAAPISVSDSEVSWETSLNYALDENQSIFGRVSDGFRGQTIQGRDVAFLEAPSVAKPETIISFEAGWKANLLDNRLYVNTAAFFYEVDDIQLSVIGGDGNVNRVVNANEGEALGFEIDFDWLVTENLRISGGYAFNDTEINDRSLGTAPCGSGLCTPLDPVDPADPARVLVDGNPFPRAPESTYNIAIRYGVPVGNSGELYVHTDWVWIGEINMPLYEAVEFRTNNQHEGGLRVGYNNLDAGWGVALFGRNITDEDNVLGFVDFSNNTGFVNEPRIWGAEFSYAFGD
ncbi:MAG: TonB-dependent receptor [Pseudomonadota bacterium]